MLPGISSILFAESVLIYSTKRTVEPKLVSNASVTAKGNSIIHDPVPISGLNRILLILQHSSMSVKAVTKHISSPAVNGMPKAENKVAIFVFLLTGTRMVKRRPSRN